MVPSDHLRKKLQQRKDSIDFGNLTTSLEAAGFRCRFPTEEFTTPAWTEALISRTAKTSSTPDSQISDSEAAQAIDQWFDDFANHHGVSGHFYLKTTLEFYPWVECHGPTGESTSLLRKAVGADLVILSPDLQKLVIFWEEEHEYVAYSREPTMLHRPDKQNHS